ncbi:MAG TPA: hypothetical protein PKD61_02020 [Polyangiaceae bacterium]|nr:hypothetical protein [Polyangiaceae bacterium]
MSWRPIWNFSWVLLAVSCGGGASGPPGVANAPSSLAPVEKPAQCRRELFALVQRVTELRDAGRLEDALHASQHGAAGCGDAQIALTEARLPILEQLQDAEALLAAAKLVHASKTVSSPGRQHAARILRTPPKPRDALVIAREATEAARGLSSKEQRAALDTALLAYERATGTSAEVVALRATQQLEMLDLSTVVAVANVLPQGKFIATVVGLNGTQEPSRMPSGSALRLLHGTTSAPAVSVAPGGTIVTSSDGEGRVYRSPDNPSRELPKASHHAALAGGRVVVADQNWLLVQEAAGGKDVVPKTNTSIGTAALLRAHRSVDRRFWTACAPPEDGPAGVVAVDAVRGAVVVNIPRADGCAFDEKGGTVVVLSGSKGAQPATVELIPLRGGTPIRVRLPALRTLTDVRLSVNAARRLAFVQTPKGLTTLHLDTGRILPRGPRDKPVGPPALRGVSVGTAGETRASVAALKRLAVPPRKLVEPAFATLQSWTANGVMSFDGKTVAAYSSNQKEEEIKLVIADAVGLKVRHRIAVPFGSNWLTAFFIDNRLLVAQSYPAYMVFDANTGQYLASIEDQGVKLWFERYLQDHSSLWDTAPGSSATDRRLDLGLQHDGFWSGTAPEREWRPKKEAPEYLRFTGDGGVVLKDMDAPRWLYCRFGEWLAPFAVCEHRFKG